MQIKQMNYDTIMLSNHNHHPLPYSRSHAN
jgi:hypothetical protein